jgi:hypothetical protein
VRYILLRAILVLGTSTAIMMLLLQLLLLWRSRCCCYSYMPCWCGCNCFSGCWLCPLPLNLLCGQLQTTTRKDQWVVVLDATDLLNGVLDVVRHLSVLFICSLLCLLSAPGCCGTGDIGAWFIKVAPQEALSVH